MAQDFDDEHPFPRIGDTAFHRHATAPDPGWAFNACMDRLPSAHDYARGYRDGAKTLFDYIDRTGERQRIDSIVYPLIFCWRQYLELTMKQLTLDHRTWEHGARGDPIHHHRLKDIWAELRPLMERVGETDASDFDALDSVVQEFVQYDPDSFAFRYPTDRKGNSSQGAIPTHINLLNLNGVMTRVARFLHASCDYIGDLLNQRADYESYMTSEYGD